MALADDIYSWYQQYLGRNPESSEVDNWLNGTYGATDPAGIQAQISSSGEASDYRRNSGQPEPRTSGGGGGGSGGGGYTAAAPSPSGGSGGGGGGTWDSGAGQGSSTFGPWTGTFQAPTNQALPDVPEFVAPTYNQAPAFAWDATAHPAPTYKEAPAFAWDAAAHPAPTYKEAPGFSYADFTGPTAAEALNDPGYQFRLDQGTQALQNAAAAKGTLADSGTLKALQDYGQGAASQEYQNVWGRDYNAYQTNRQGALDTYNTNYKTQYQDPYAAAVAQYGTDYGHALDTYNTNYKTQYQDPYAAAVAQYGTDYGHALDTYNTNYKTQYQDPYAASYKAAQDAFAPKILGYTTTAQNIQHQNDLANTNAYNDYLLHWQDYQGRRSLGANFALGS